jgi:hypothetical protein
MLFFLPGLVSVALFALLWRSGSFAHPTWVAALCATGLALQFLAPTSSAPWLVGLLINVGMAVWLVVRLQLSNEP